MSLLTSALAYAEHGIPVFPVHGIDAQGNCTCAYPGCTHAGKHPILKGGLGIATTDLEQINVWWESHPDANIGVPTGRASGWYVVDVDQKHHGIDNYRRFSEQHKNGLPSATLKVSTGGGGFHLIYAQPTDGQTVGSGNNLGQLRGVSLRGEGGYIVVPPSRHYQQKDYRWLNNFSFHDPHNLANLQPLPVLIANLANMPKSAETKLASQVAAKGERNTYLFTQACLFRSEVQDGELLFDRVWAENQSFCKPPLEKTEVGQIVANALKLKIKPTLYRKNFPEKASGKALNPPSKAKNKKHTGEEQFERLINLTVDHEFWVDAVKKQFVTFPVANKSAMGIDPSVSPTAIHYENWPIGSKNYRHFIERQYRLQYQESPPKVILDSVLEILAGNALFGDLSFQTHIRTARYEDRIFIDLTNDHWHCVEISASGWSLSPDKPPVKFLRTNNVEAMPIPDPSGDFHSLRQVFRLSSQDDYVLLAAWLMYALIENGPYPVLALEGVAGSSKSTVTKQIKQLLDPRKPFIQSVPRNIGDLFITANNAHLITIDNLSEIGQDLSNILCGIATGTGFSKRALYSDSDEVYYDVCKPIVFNSINSVIDFSDLADRSIRLCLPPIGTTTNVVDIANQAPLPASASERLGIEEINARFQQWAPKIMGAIFNAIQAALPHYKTIRALPAEIRMMDFAQWAVAAGKALTNDDRDFTRIFLDNRRHSSLPLLEANVLSSALLKLMKSQAYWSGSPTELFNVLSDLVGAEEKQDKTFPKRANQLTRELNKSITTLKQFGIDYSHSDGNNHKVRRITIKFTPQGNQSAHQLVRDAALDIDPVEVSRVDRAELDGQANASHPSNPLIQTGQTATLSRPRPHRIRHNTQRRRKSA